MVRLDNKVTVTEMSFVKVKLMDEGIKTRNFTSNVYWIAPKMDIMNWTKAASNYYQTNTTYMADFTSIDQL